MIQHFFKDGEEIPNLYKKDPVLIIKLKPSEEFIFKGTAILGTAKKNNIWAATSPCYYIQVDEDEHEYEFIFETLGQLTHKEIMLKAFNIILFKLENIERSIGTEFNDLEFENKTNAIFKLENEGHTMGNLITHSLQNNKNVVFAGFKKDHLLIDEIIIRLETRDYNPLRCFFNTLSELKKIYTENIGNINKLDFI